MDMLSDVTSGGQIAESGKVLSSEAAHFQCNAKAGTCANG